MRSYPLIVIGAGAGGLVVAIGSAKAGKKVLLIDKGTWGGDCTNFGCIPSKSLIASSETAHAQKKGEELGLEGGSPFTNCEKALERVRKIVALVRSHEDPKSLQEKGVHTLTGRAHFLDAHRLLVTDFEGKEEIVFGQKIVIAAGSSPHIPDIEGLKNTPFHTNETIFDLRKVPSRLCILGGGPIGCELSQAFQRLNSKVSLIQSHSVLLEKEEPEAQKILAQVFAKEGVKVYFNYRPNEVRYQDGQFFIQAQSENETVEIAADVLLVATGREANVDNLQLDAAKIHYSKQGIKVDKFGRTNQKHIWAVGDVTGGPLFTHAAENQARTVLASLLLPFKKRMDRQPMPRTTFTDPEIASFGLLQHQAREKYGKEKVKTYYVPLSENDRALTSGREEGFVKVVTKKMSSKILGATIVSPRAGEMLPELQLAALEKIPLRKLSGLIHSYPIYNLAIRKAADLWLTETFLPWLKHPLKGIAWKRFIPIFIILAAMIVAYAMGLHKYLTVDMLKAKRQILKDFANQYPIIGPILYIFIYAIATSLSLPGGALLSLIGGFLFPIPWSTLYVLIGATAGASVIFLAAKTAFSEILKKKAGPFLKKMEAGFRKNAWSYLLFLRFVPLFPFWLVNIAPAFFQVPFFTFLWTTFVGIIPGAYAYTQAGAGLGAILDSDQPFSLSAIFNIQIRIALIVIGIISLMPIFIKKFFLKKKG